MYGTVTRYDKNRGFGFIYAQDGNTYFIHHSKLYGEEIDRGYFVYFKPFRNDRSDFNAKGVNVIEAPEINKNGGITNDYRQTKISNSIVKENGLH